MIRKIKRNMLKIKYGTNDINRQYHALYVYKPNADKTEIKPLERLKRKLRKLAHKKARQNRKKVV